MTMPTPAHEAAFEAFLSSAIDGEALEYPERAAFIGFDMEDRDETLWRYLRDGRTAIIVNEDRSEIMIAPARVGLKHRLINHFLRRYAVDVYFRYPTGRTSVAMSADVGEHALGELHDAVHA